MFLMWMDSIALPAVYYFVSAVLWDYRVGVGEGGHTGCVQGPNTHTTALIAIDFLDKYVFGGCLDGYTFVAVGDFYVVKVAVRLTD